MDEPLNLVLFSGTDDKLQAAAVLTAGAAALGKPVNIFLQYWALDAFRAAKIGEDHGLAPEAGPAGRIAVDALAAAGQATWAETLRQAKDLGAVDIQACSPVDGPAPSRIDRSRPARRRRRGRDRLLPQRRRGPGRLHLINEVRKENSHASRRDHPDGRCPRAVLPDADRQDRPGRQAAAVRAPSSSCSPPTPGRSRTSRPGAGRPATSSSSRHRMARSTASSSAGSEARHDHRDTRPVDPLAAAIAAVDGWPEAADHDRGAGPGRRARASDGQVATKDLLIIDYSGDLEKVWATMILASTSAAMGVRTRVFVTFWGLQVFVKDSKRITGENWMQRMLSAMQRPGHQPPEALEDELPRDGSVDDGPPCQAVRRRQPARSSSRPPRRWASSSSRAR